MRRPTRWQLGPGRPGPPATVKSGDSLTQEAYLSWRGLARRTVRARAVHDGARRLIMHHSGCTSRQLTPFEIRCLRPTISRSPGDQGGPVRWLGYQLDTCHRPSTKRILQHVTGNPVDFIPAYSACTYGLATARRGGQKSTTYTAHVRLLHSDHSLIRAFLLLERTNFF